MIYIACPSKLATGGTELLHQLYFKLSKFSQQVRVFYFDNTSNENPVNQRFIKYNIQYVNKIIDCKKNIIIVPETCTELLSNYTEVKKVIWWLSVDNYYSSIFGFGLSFSKQLSYIIKSILRKRFISKFVNFSDYSIYHFVQSYYAWDFLNKKGTKHVYYLSDYIGENILSNTLVTKESREDIVLYNPKKGISFTRRLIQKNKNVKFIPLENMSQDQIISICLKSKVYIDFGNHPGKDRFPREAAHLGCIIITGNKGSSSNNTDVPILSKYKFQNKISQIPKIIQHINECIINYDVYVKDFEDYRRKIVNEEETFNLEIEIIWNSFLKNFVV